MKKTSHGVLSVVAALMIAWVVGAGAEEARTAAPVSSDAAARALSEAARYADVRYEHDGRSLQGVAYRWGGRAGLDEYLAAVAGGATPGEEAGIDASALVVNAYRAAIPDLMFVTRVGGEARLTADATSATLYEWNVQPIELDQVRAGDLIFFADPASGRVTGVAVFERREGPNVHFVVASAGSGRVVRTFLNVNNDYWQTRVKAVGRLLSSER